MKTRLAIVSSVLAFAGCTTSDEALELQALGGAPVHGTELSCSPVPSNVLTPCWLGSTPTRGTFAYSPQPGVLRMQLGLSTNAADAGEVSLQIDLDFGHGHGDRPRITARQAFQFSQMYGVPDRDPLPALDGWVKPVEVSSTLAGRNAGRFSIDFEWGTVSGAYDSAD